MFPCILQSITLDPLYHVEHVLSFLIILQTEHFERRTDQRSA